MKRPKMEDIAREANVGIATVDRVLNARAKVSERTSLQVFAAAKKLGYHSTPLIQMRIREQRPVVKLGFLMQSPRMEIYALLAQSISEACQNTILAQAKCDVMIYESLAIAQINDALKEVAENNDAIAIVCPDHPQIVNTINDIRARGKPVITMLSDLAGESRNAYIGTDNYKMGRTAGWFLTQADVPSGDYLCLVGSTRFRGQEARESGFRSYLREYASNCRVLDTTMNYERPEISYEIVTDMIKNNPHLKGIYACAGGVAGVVEALRDLQMSGQLRVALSEITDVTKGALVENLAQVTFATPVAKICHTTVNAMINAIQEEGAVHSLCYLPFEIYVRESI